MITLRRFVAIQLFCVWQGGFLFYAACVVPVGTALLGAAGQGAITARVTNLLNIIGVIALLGFALDLLLTRDPRRRRRVSRGVLWSVAAVCQFVLVNLHLRMEALMDNQRMFVMIVPPFYPLHRVYLWTSTVQWLACLVLMWFTLRAWRGEDETLAANRSLVGRNFGIVTDTAEEIRITAAVVR